MLSQLFRSLNRQSFKSIQSHSYVKRFYSNQELNQKSGNEEKCYQSDDCDEYSRVYQEYYRRYYDNWKNKFDNNSSDRQTDNNDSNGRKSNHKNNEKFNSNSYSFSECKYHLLTLKLLEKVGYLGTAIIVGLHFETPLHPYSRRRAIRSCDQTDGSSKDDKCSTNICGKCKYCEAFLSKLAVLSAPIKRNYILPKVSERFLKSHKPNDISNLNEDLKESKSLDPISDESNDNQISFEIKANSDPIDDICRQLQTASIDYLDGLNNMLGIALIHTEPEEAMKCWSVSKSNPKALFNMGVAYESGRHSTDGTVDMRRAYEHYCLSASMGHKQAIYNLSLFYLYGKGGIPVDLTRAEALLTRAAKLGVKAAEQYIQALELKRRAQLKEKTAMRSSASAPNLSVLSTCFEFYNNENLNKYKQNYKTIANRV